MKNIGYLLILIFCAASLMAVTDTGKKYIKEIKKERRKIQREFRNPEKSPLRDAAPGSKKLKFFPVKSKYRVRAKFKRTGDAAPFDMPTSDPNRNKPYVKYGDAMFELDGTPYVLSIYRNIKLSAMPKYKHHLFLPFKDHTNGHQSYGGGRYLDLETTEISDELIIDFNRCYNPYCAYSTGWSCPIPPQENHLEVEIKAGVKVWDTDH